MKRWTVTAGIVVLLLGLAAVASDLDLKLLSESAERARLTELGLGYTDPGNAAEDYWPYFNGSAPLMKAPWWKKITELMKSEDPAGKAALHQAIQEAGPELDRLLAASRKKDYQLWGVFIKPDPKTNIVELKAPEYFDLFVPVRLLMARAQELEAGGEKKAVEEHYFAVIRIGNHLEQDPLTMSYILGNALKTSAASALVKFYETQGAAETAKKWDQYLSQLKARKETVRLIGEAMIYWSQAQAEPFIRNEDMPTCYRLEALANRVYCMESKEAGLKCKAMGPPAWVKKLKKEVAFEDPQARVILALLDNPLTAKQMLSIGFGAKPGEEEK